MAKISDPPTSKPEKPLRVLHLEDDPADVELVQATLEEAGLSCQITWAKTATEFKDALHAEQYDLILADYQLPGYDGLKAMHLVKAQHPEIPFIFVSGTISEDAAIQAFTEGGTDYVPKRKLARLVPAIERALEYTELRQKHKEAQEALETERKRMEIILSALNTGLSLINPDMTIAWANLKTREMFPGREPVGQVCHLFYESRTTICDGCGTIQAFMNGKVCESEQLVPASGRWFYIISQPIKDTTGRVVNVLEGITDITERKQAEERLHLQSAALEAAANAIVITDLAGNIQWANSAFTRLTGYTTGEVVCRNPRLLKSGLQDQVFYQDLWNTILAGRTWHGEIVNKRKDGSQYFEEMTIAPVRQPSGAISHFVAIKQDISERKQAEKIQTSVYRISEATQSTNNLADLYKQIHSAVSELMPARNFFIASYDPASDLLHFPYFADERDTDWSSIKPGRSLSAYVLRKGNPLLATPEVFEQLKSTGEVELVGESTVDWLGVPLKTQQGQSIGVMAVQTYTTDVRLNSTDMEILTFVSTQVAMAIERKQAEGKLIQALERSELAGRAARLGIWDWDISRNELVWDDRMYELFGVKREDFSSAYDTLLAGIHPDDRAYRDKVSQQALRGEGDYDTEFRVVWPDGTERVLKAFGQVVRDAAGQPLRIAGVNYDITESKRVELQIEEQLNRMKALHTIDGFIKTSFDLKNTLEVLLNQVTTELKVDAASILLINKNTLTLTFAAGHGFWSSAIQHTKLKPGEGYAGRVFVDREIIHIPDLTKEENKLTHALASTGEDFGAYLGVPLIAKRQTLGVLEIFHRAELNPNADWFTFLEMLTDQAAIAIDNLQLFENLQRSNLELIMAYDATIEGWSHALDLRDEETEGHTQRVANLTVQLAQQMAVPEADILHIRRGALLHDIGKMGIPDTILRKPGKLTEDEWEIMRQHPAYAHQMLAPIIYLHRALDIPYCHHEKWDGSGYPRGLKGEQIPLSARIFAIVDVYDALTSDRPYRKAWMREQALEYIREQSGIHFDPQVVKRFLELEEKITTDRA